jgi:hypothetical protein
MGIDLLVWGRQRIFGVEKLLPVRFPMKRILSVALFVSFCSPCHAADVLKPYNLKKGEVGVFKLDKDCCFKVSQILGDNEMILREEGFEEQLDPAIARIATPDTPRSALFRKVYFVGKRFAIIKGVSTDGLIDGSEVQLKGGFKVTSTRTMPLGSTYFVVEALSGKEKQAFDDAEKKSADAEKTSAIAELKAEYDRDIKKYEHYLELAKKAKIDKKANGARVFDEEPSAYPSQEKKDEDIKRISDKIDFLKAKSKNVEREGKQKEEMQRPEVEKEKQRKQNDPIEIKKREEAEKARLLQNQNDEAASLLRRAKLALGSAKQLADVPTNQDRLEKFKNKAQELLESLLRLYPESPSATEAKKLLDDMKK